jgi:glycosyltransferase involved in cell wall biosynthesis
LVEDPPVKLVALTICRNEDWILEFCLRSALTWADEVVVIDDGSEDDTKRIVGKLQAEYRGRIHATRREHGEHWDEMAVRQQSLAIGRERGGTHFAIVDADEALTANTAKVVGGYFEKLESTQLLETPMLAMRTLKHYQDDASVWSGAWLTIGFKDAPWLSWQPAVDGYQHHHRPPFGAARASAVRLHTSKAQGGAFHFQFANRRRLLAKHVLYRMVDHLRWPGRETVKDLNWKYDQALQNPARCSSVPVAWYEGLDPALILLDGEPWHEQEARRLLALHGSDAFKGLDLKGVQP